jgi:hypothetical protein
VAKQGERDPSRLSPRRQRDTVLLDKIRTSHPTHFGVYGVRKKWHHLRHDGEAVAKYTAARLMGVEGIQGIVRGAWIDATRPPEDPGAKRLTSCNPSSRQRVPISSGWWTSRTSRPGKASSVSCL